MKETAVEPVSTNFPTMGKSMASPRNISAKPSPNTKTVARAGGVGGALESVLAPSRRHTQERLGNVGMPQTSMAPKDEASAHATERNVRTLPSAMKYTDPFGDYSREQRV